MHESVWLYGDERPLREVITGRAGPVAFDLEDGMLKRVRLGDVEVLRRVYFAVRTDEWDTIYPVFDDMQIEHGPDTFHASWSARCRGGEVDYAWHGEVVGDADGTIHFTVVGEPHADFRSNRVGICLLLSGDLLGGRPFTLSKPNGRTDRVRFPRIAYPELVGAQFRGIQYQPPGGPPCVCSIDGALFDMEDQRNYADTTFKAYAPMPHEYPVVRKGARFSQTFTLTFPDGVPKAPPTAPADEPVIVRVGEPLPGVVVPSLGVDLTGGPVAYEPDQLRLLAGLNAHHLRLELDMAHAAVPRPGLVPAPALFLSVRNFCPEAVDKLKAEVHNALDRTGATSLFVEIRSVPTDLLRVAREALASFDVDLLVGGPGVDMFIDQGLIQAFADAEADFLSWHVSPAVHQEDDETYMENTLGIADELAGARVFIPPGRRAVCCVSPINLASPWPRPRPDPRQTGLFTAAWTACAVKHLAEGGGTLGTFFRSVGGAGVIYARESYPQPAFDDRPGSHVYPVYHVLRWLGAVRDEPLHEALSSHAHDVEAIAAARWVLVANKTHRPRSVRVHWREEPPTRAAVRTLDAETFMAGCAAPGGVAPELAAQRIEVRDGRLDLRLRPFGVAWLAAEGECVRGVRST